MNKINVFWIEDNPLSVAEKINGVRIPIFFYEGLFTYHLFQHPKEVEDYLQLLKGLQEEHTISTIAEVCPMGIPDIIVFDYKLADNLETTHAHALKPDNEIQYNFLREKSANLKIKNSYPSIFKRKTLFIERKDVREGNYSQDELKEELKAKKIENDDEFGLYCGITILREFKNYISVGIPATINKLDKGTMSYNSLFYEWLNSYDIKDAIERPNYKSDDPKNWGEILDFSVDLLRKRISTQVKSGKITLNLPQLMEYTNEEKGLPDKKEERILTFKTDYGIRKLPIDGLFIDNFDKSKAEKKDVIVKYFSELLENVNLLAEYKSAKTSAKTLINGYKSDNAEKRAHLSYQMVRLANGEIDENNDALTLLRDYFEVDNSNDKIGTHINDLKKEKKYDKKKSNRLIVLFTDILLHKHYQEFVENNKDINNSLLERLKEPPTYTDLLLALNPVSDSPLIREIDKKYVNDKALVNTDNLWDKNLKDLKLRGNSHFPANLTSGEKAICKNYALELKLDRQFSPTWLK